MPIISLHVLFQWVYLYIYFMIFYGTLGTFNTSRHFRIRHPYKYSLLASVGLWSPFLVMALVEGTSKSMIRNIYFWVVEVLILLVINILTSINFDLIRKATHTGFYNYKSIEILVKTVLTFIILPNVGQYIIWYS